MFIEKELYLYLYCVCLFVLNRELKFGAFVLHAEAQRYVLFVFVVVFVFVLLMFICTKRERCLLFVPEVWHFCSARRSAESPQAPDRERCLLFEILL